MTKLVDGQEFSIIAKNKICFVTLNSEATLNAISLRMASIMESICVPNEENNGSLFEKFLVDQICHVIVVQSEVEGIFSSGGNLLELQKWEEIPTHKTQMTMETSSTRSNQNYL
jgi:enoyl-CoA hydratase/carnithine racemase